MENLSYKLKIAALWVLNMVFFIVYRTIALNENAVETSLLSNGELATMLALMFLFAVLTVFLKYKLNRSTNIIAGTVFGVAHLAVFVDGIIGYPTAIFNIMSGISILLMAAVIWLAVRWRKPNA